MRVLLSFSLGIIISFCSCCGCGGAFFGFWVHGLDWEELCIGGAKFWIKTRGSASPGSIHDCNPWHTLEDMLLLLSEDKVWREKQQKKQGKNRGGVKLGDSALFLKLCRSYAYYGIASRKQGSKQTHALYFDMKFGLQGRRRWIVEVLEGLKKTIHT